MRTVRCSIRRGCAHETTSTGGSSDGRETSAPTIEARTYIANTIQTVSFSTSEAHAQLFILAHYAPRPQRIRAVVHGFAFYPCFRARRMLSTFRSQFCAMSHTYFSEQACSCTHPEFTSSASESIFLNATELIEFALGQYRLADCEDIIVA